MRIHVEGDPGRAADVHWRGIVLTNFDGKRWFTPAHDQVVLSPNPDGEFRFVGLPLPRGDFYPLRYTVLMEPIATDAIFVAPPAGSSARAIHGTNPTVLARRTRMAICCSTDRLALQSFPQRHENPLRRPFDARRDSARPSCAKPARAYPDAISGSLPAASRRSIRASRNSPRKSPKTRTTNTTEPRTSSAT